MFEVKLYKGDENFKKILDRNNIPVDIYNLKAAILGVQASAGSITLLSLAKDFFNDKVLANREVADQLESLWFYLLRLQRFDDNEIEQPDFNNKTRGAYTAYVLANIMRAETFLKYLSTGQIDEMRNNEKVNKIYSIFVGNVNLLKALVVSMEEKWSEDDFANDTTFLKKLTGFVRVMWDTQLALKEHAKIFNLQKMNNKNIINAIQQQTGTQIGRNDPCPCGSGKKYKNCCGK
ncbi:MAG: SEC-C metal-binding domain-containing protein [Spirochaetes bacterium]|nr:SEC-C metal-binding domain-containing protein [Spirochaetota bacterium]